MTNWKANALLIVAGAMWGMGFVAQSTAMTDLGPLLFIGLRFLAGTVSILPFAVREARNSKELSRSDRMAFAGIGVLLFAGMTAQQFGLLTTSVTNSGFSPDSMSFWCHFCQFCFSVLTPIQLFGPLPRRLSRAFGCFPEVEYPN
jgi:drug/metabolite transporter (DMT)-like permease